MRTVLSAGLIVLCTPPAEGQSRPPRELGNFPVATNTVSTGEVLVSWQPVQKASAYEMERCEGAALTTCAMKTTPRITAGQPLQVRDNLIASGTYLYRVTAYGSKQLPIAQGQVGYVYTAPLTVVLMPAVSGTITPTPAGPAQLSAISPVPGQIHLSWSHVPSATRYRVFRTIVGSGPERELAPPGTDPSGNTPDRYIDAPVDLRWIYSYKVLAYVKPGATEIPTTPSPLATASGWVGYMVPASTSPGVIVIEGPRPPRGTITPIPAGPSSLTAESSIPGQIQLRWQEVANASGYRVTRSSTAPEAETKLVEFSSTSQPAGGNWPHTDAPVDDRWTFSYKVYALFETTVSTPSPVASANSIAVIQPTGLKYGVTLIPTPGRVNVTLSWTGVPNVATYVMTGADFIGMPTITTAGTSYTLNNVPASHTYRVCVGAAYPYSIGDPDTPPCVDINLS